MAVTYPGVNLVGTLLSGGVVERIGEGDPDVPGIDPQSYQLAASESVRRLANAKYTYLREAYQDFVKRRSRARSAAHLARLTRDDWLSVLLRELTYNDVSPVPDGIPVEDQRFPVSHWWQRTVPIHLLPWDADLDRRAGGSRGLAAAAPHAMVQRLLNQSDDYLWAVLSNGQRLRLLRDTTSLVGQAYLEFDLQAIFEGELFPDFVLLYRIAHASRLKVRDAAIGPASCLLEEWRAYGARQGERALGRLRGGVEDALEILGTGFLDHPANRSLREQIGETLSLADFKRSLLRLVYKVIFWMVAEDREVLLDPAADQAAKSRYDTYLSSRRLRRLASTRRYSHHGDLWESVKLVFSILGPRGGSPLLGLPGLGGVFDLSPLDQPLHESQLTNAALLQAVEALSVLAQRKGRRLPVDWRHLGAEELGSVYEALLELHPQWDPAARRFSFTRPNGNDRKKTGAYYTPSQLVEQLLDSTLEPLLDEACTADTKAERIKALLDITVCDPACGSGAFLIGAGRRIARRIAAEETDEPEPGIEAVRKALRAVVSRCLYGVDINEMVVELAKLSLWLEAVEPGRPLGYLDHNIRVGNSLLGATPALLDAGIPDAAFAPLEGDDRRVVAALRRQNAAERRGVRQLADVLDIGNADLAEEATAIAHLAPCETLTDVHVQAQRAKALDAELRRRREIADAWCAAFVAPKIERTRPYAITHAMLERLASGERDGLAGFAWQVVQTMARQYRFFHWHLEFPHIFRTSEDDALADYPSGWRGGFSCVLGNVPWERVKLQQQEFFAAQSAEIAQAPNAAARRRMVAELANSMIAEERTLHRRWVTALRTAEGTSHFLRSAGRHPLTGKGDINTYAVFAETAREILSGEGMVGIIAPTGIATDATTQDFFKDLVMGRNLVSIYDFENEEKIFPTVTNRSRFALLTVSGERRPVDRVSLVFQVRQANQIRARAYSLTPDEITLLNPNTGTCPVFKSRRDAEITLGVYRRVPVLWREEDAAGIPWGLSFLAMFHMANDSGLFKTAEELIADGWKAEGNCFERGGERMLPLYEAKMTGLFDHRFATYENANQAQLNKGTLPRLDDAAHSDPHRSVLPEYWMAESAVAERLGDRWPYGWLLGWRDIARSTDERTLIATVIPRTAAGDKFLLALPPSRPACFQANLSSIVLDYVTRQKYAGSSLKYYVVKQLPVLAPERYDEPVPWDRGESLEGWITSRVLELTYTAYDIAAYARDLGDNGPPFRWNRARREMMRAELDAAYFHLYGIGRDDVEYIMDTFKVVRQKDEAAHGEYRTKRLIIERYDAMAGATRTSKPYQTPLDPPPGHGPRHTHHASKSSEYSGV